VKPPFENADLFRCFEQIPFALSQGGRVAWGEIGTQTLATTVVVVDHEPEVRDFICSVLADAGYDEICLRHPGEVAHDHPSGAPYRGARTGLPAVLLLVQARSQ
jgi:hypothetical protein